MSEAETATKRCLTCAEAIHVKAVKCRHCGAGQPGDGVTEPPCEQCGGHVVATTYRVRPVSATFAGVVLIVGGFLGLPLFGLGAIGIIGGILLLALVKNNVDIIRCVACKASRKHRLAPFYKP